MSAAEQKLAALDAETQLPVLHFLLQVVEKIYYNPTQMKFRAIKTSHEVRLGVKWGEYFFYSLPSQLKLPECPSNVCISRLLGVLA